MRRFLLLFLVLLVGCSGEKILIEDPYLEENYDNNTESHQLYFTLINKAWKNADCKAEMILENEGVINTTLYDIGIVSKRSSKQVRVDFIMPYGETGFNLTPKCSFD